MDRQLLEYKLQMQKSKMKLRHLEGVAILQIFESGEDAALNKMLSMYYPVMCSANTVPHSKISFKASEVERLSRIISEMVLEKEQECFFLCDGVWAKLKLIDLKLAVKSLWEHNLKKQGKHKTGVVGFLIVKANMDCIMDVGCDSRDEYHYLIDMWDYTV